SNRVEKLAGDTDPSVRSAAIRALAAFPSAQATAILERLLKASAAGQLAEIVQALGSMAQNRPERKSTAAAIKVLQHALGAGKQATSRQEALNALAGTRLGTAWLLELQARGGLADDLKPEAGRLLRNSPHQDLRNRAMIAFPPAGRLDPKKL